jgi:hypothetical protein
MGEEEGLVRAWKSVEGRSGEERRRGEASKVCELIEGELGARRGRLQSSSAGLRSSVRDLTAQRIGVSACNARFPKSRMSIVFRTRVVLGNH